MKKRFYTTFAILCLWAAFVVSPLALAQVKSIQAVFLYNILHYFQWPKSVDPKIYNVCMVGKPDLLEPLKKIKNKSKDHDHTLNLYVYKNVEDAQQNRNCNLVYFDKSVKVNSDDLKPFYQRSVLTVGSQNRFSKIGMVELAAQGGNLRLIINMRNVNKSQLSISSRLLRVATVVDE